MLSANLIVRQDTRGHRVPCEAWCQAWSSNPPERLNKEIRRCTDVAGIVLAVVIRPVDAVLTQQNDKWA